MCVYGFCAGTKEFTAGNALGGFNDDIFGTNGRLDCMRKKHKALFPIVSGKASFLRANSSATTSKSLRSTVAMEAVNQRKVVKALLTYG